MKHLKFTFGLLLTSMTVFTACNQEEFVVTSPVTEEGNAPEYATTYTAQQLINWEQTGSPFLENELDNSANTLIDPSIPSYGGIFKPITEIHTRAWGVHPYQNRFWSMIRLKLTVTAEPLRSYVIQAISEIEAQTNIRFYNAINDPVKDPIYNIVYPNVYISLAPRNQIGSSHVGLQGGEQYIYLTSNADVAFIKRALVNVAGMYNEYQRNDRDTYVNVYTNNVLSENRYHFNKITSNYYGMGSFDWNSITMNGSYIFSSNGQTTLTKKSPSGAILQQNTELSNLDRSFLNYFYLPYIGRTDVYRELDTNVYKSDNTLCTDAERRELEYYLNNGASNPGPQNRINPVAW